MKKIALFAGSFDPITYGHLDTINRAQTLFDEVIVAVSTNTSKKNLFTQEERIAFVEELLDDDTTVRVIPHTGGLTVDMAKEVGATALVRGVRNTKDFEYEEAIAMMNRTQAPDLETILLFSSPEYRFISSSLIKEVAQFGGDIRSLVPPIVAKAMEQKVAKNPR